MVQVVEAMRLLNAAGNRIDQAQGELQAAGVPFDVKPFRTLQDCLTEAFCAISNVPLAQAELKNTLRGRQC